MNFKKILSCILCFFVTISASLPPAKAVDAATVLIVTGLLQGVPQGLAFIFDKGGKIHAVVSHNDEVKKYIADKTTYGGLRTLVDMRRMLTDIVDGVSPIPVYGQTLAKRQCFDAVSGCIGRIKAMGLEKRGNIIYMIGPSGTGKTTMARAIADAFLKHSDRTCCFVECSQIAKDKELGTQLFKTVTRPANLCPSKKSMGFWEGVVSVMDSGKSTDPMSAMGTYEITVAAPILDHILRWDGNVVVIIDEFDKMKRLCTTQSFDGDLVVDKSADEILKSISSNGFYMIGDTKVDCSNVLFIITTNESREELEQNFGQGGVVGGGAQRLNIVEFGKLDDECSKRIIGSLSDRMRVTLTNPAGEFKLNSVNFSDQTLANMAQYVKDSDVKQGRAKDDLWDGVFGLCVRYLSEFQYNDVEFIFKPDHSFDYAITPRNTPSSASQTTLNIMDFSNVSASICDYGDETCLVDYSN